LKKIAKEKAEYPAGRKKEFTVEPIAQGEERFELPTSWSWARTNDVTVYVQRGKSPKYTLEKKVPVIAQKCVQWSGFQLEKAQFIEPTTLSAYGEERYVQDGDLLWNSTGHGSLGRIIVFKERFKGKYPIIVADSHVTVIRPSKSINPDYLFCWFAGPIVQDEINDKSTGTTNQTELPVGTVLAYDIPLPPLPEQHRIVAKVEELMALCDRLEAAQQQREAERTRLTAAAWQAVVQVEAPAEVSFALEQLSVLTTRPAQVKALRQTILDLAVRGRLVEQEEGDEPAEVLLERIRKEKERLVKEGKIKVSDHPNSIEADELPLQIPLHWKWARGGRLHSVQSGRP
jgi:type I restriction enzyme S subunit